MLEDFFHYQFMVDHQQLRGYSSIFLMSVLLSLMMMKILTPCSLKQLLKNQYSPLGWKQTRSMLKLKMLHIHKLSLNNIYAKDVGNHEKKDTPLGDLYGFLQA